MLSLEARRRSARPGANSTSSADKLHLAQRVGAKGPRQGFGSLLGKALACVLLASVAVQTTLPVSVAYAQQPAAPIDREQARALFQEALAHVAGGDYVSALEQLQQVASYKRTPQVLYYIALCHEKTGKLVMALGEYRIALADAQKEPSAAQVVSEASAAIAALEPRIPKMTISKGQGAQTAQILVDGKELGEASIGTPMPFDPGTRVVTATAEGFEPFRQEVVLTEGAKVAVEITLNKKPEVTPEGGATGNEGTPTPGIAPDKPAPEPSSIMPTLGWVITGVGVAGLATSGVFYAKRASAISDLEDKCGPDKLHCPSSAQSTYDNGKRDTTIGNVALGVGVAGVVTGVILLLTSGSKSESPQYTQQTTLKITPAWQGAYQGLHLQGAF